MSETITATFEVATRDADQTRALGEDLGRILAAGDLLMLSGGLGAGKTTLVNLLMRFQHSPTKATPYSLAGGCVKN